MIKSSNKDHHATIFVAPAVAESIEAVRRTWDPVMAAQISAHVTLTYPKEAPISDLLIERVRTASAETAPFRLRLGRLRYFGRPDDGIYIDVTDVDGGYQRMRECVLRPPFNPVAFPTHVTLVHPRTSTLGRTFWEVGRYQPHDCEFTVAEVTITAFDGTKWIVLERFALGL